MERLFKNRPYKDAYGIYKSPDSPNHSYYYSDSTSIPHRYLKVKIYIQIQLVIMLMNLY